MICVSVGEKTAEKCLKALKGLKFAEIRIDMLEPSERTGPNIKKIFSQSLPLIATCKPEKVDDAARRGLLGTAIENGAKYVDIELESKEDFKEEISRKAKTKGCRIIISYHNFDKTPPLEELRHIVQWCFESGADIAKIACMVNDEKDSARLLGLLDSENRGRLIVIGMGEKGRITRIAAPLLGAAFTFASVSEESATAPGQIGREELEEIIDKIKKMSRHE